MNAQTQSQAVDRDDIQGLLRTGYGRYPEACFLLLRITDREAARAWLASAPVTSVAMIERPSGSGAPSTAKTYPDTVLQVALSSEGLRALGVVDEVIEGFAEPFVSGMAGNANRSRRLGDVGTSAPDGWRWGAGQRLPHVLVLLYARTGRLEAWRAEIEGQCTAGFERLDCLATATTHTFEPFGFRDGISQPQIDWERQRPVRDEKQLDYSNLGCLGEFVLGYPNEYGGYTDRPLLDARGDAQAALPRAEDAPDKADLGRNGSYLAFRQLQQDVKGFWKYLDGAAGGDAGLRERLAASMVGRTRQGVPLVDTKQAIGTDGDGTARVDLNDFTYQSDPDGARCPLGAHIRRANPRNADLPPGGRGIVSRLKRVLGFDAEALQRDRVASTRFHRILRRGRRYGPEDPLASPPAGTSGEDEAGLHFICLGANLARQFEFVQDAWVAGTKFDGLTTESDPLLGPRTPALDGTRTDGYSIPRPDGACRRMAGMPRFVKVVGGGYFFLPGIRALRYLAKASTKASMNATNSNASRPIPPPNTGSAILNWIARASLAITHFERRFDPFFRPAFDAVLRDPIARLVTWLINRRRPNERLKIAEERPLPDEEQFVDSIIASFRQQMRLLWKPGGYERGGNTKTHGIVRAEFTVHDGLPDGLRNGIYAEPRTFRAWVRFSGPGPYVTPDIDDVGFMSISVKLLGVPGPKFMEEEKFTQDLFGVSTPTFVTPDVRANAQLQIASLKNAAIFHFINLHRSHVLDLIMQTLWTKTQSSPFEAPYFSCVPYLLGEGRAMQYSFWPKTRTRTRIPRLPLRPPDDYLRAAMVQALDAGDVEFEVRLQLQTDPHLMPIENAGVLWPERLSPRVPVATLRIPRQKFDSPTQMEFAKRLSYNAWHCIPEHRPLGNQSRARRRMYLALSTLRHDMNAVPHYEPTGDEVFE